MVNTSISRRQALGGLAAAMATAPTFSAVTCAAPAPIREITARPGQAKLLEPDQPNTPIWGYDGGVPGPEIRTPQGSPFAADLVNQLPQATTIHWHGIRNLNAMDGAANLTQPPVQPNASFAYRFSPPDAGTYWYHPHNRTWEQLARGLYGAFIVTEEKPPSVDQDLVLMFDDWRINEKGKIDEASLGSFHDLSHAGRLGNILTVNGKFTHDIPVKAGERLRLRLINTSNARVLSIGFANHTQTVVALDGQPVAPFAPKGGFVQLAPAQRADVIIDCTQDIGARTAILADTGREKLETGHLVYHPQQRQRTGRLNDPVNLPPNPMPTHLDAENVQTIDLDMTGGARSWFKEAMYRGKTHDVRTLARDHGKVWAFNGIAGMPEKPLARIERGRTVHVRIRNGTAWPHAMHFHGHHVREVAHSARAALPHWRDTVYVAPDETIAVAFNAHNSGKWMLHCHMLAHQAGGMSTWYEVT